MRIIVVFVQIGQIDEVADLRRNRAVEIGRPNLPIFDQLSLQNNNGSMK